MGCGASKNDVIKSASSSENEPKKKEPAAEANGDTARANGKARNSSSNKVEDSSSKDSSSRNSLDSEGSTIPASEKFGNGNNNEHRGANGSGGFEGLRSGSSNRNLPDLPPLKPARTSKVGFLLDTDQQPSGEGAMAAESDRSSKAVPVAFEVPAEEDASLIKKHPPRRLRQLEERPPETNDITKEALEEKVALANERRNQVLHQRVASARQKSARVGGRVRRPVLDSELETNETMDGDPGGTPGNE